MLVARVISPISSRESWTVLGDEDFVVRELLAVDLHLGQNSRKVIGPRIGASIGHDLHDRRGQLTHNGVRRYGFF
jgi:integrase/recombinase XerD